MWSTRPVFVSSTFRDMQAERDHLRNVVFPEIEERLRAWGRHLEWVDLRIGVAGASLADEGERELQVLKVCLDEVRRCRPFLIVLLGDRYGWIPPPERVSAAAHEVGFSGALTGRSVTDLEIDLGILQNADQQTRSRFYFREPLPYAAMPRGIAAEYADENTDAVRDLKTRIERALPDRVRRYSAAWDTRARRVTGLDTWGRQVADDLWSEIEVELAIEPASSIADPLERERATLDGFLEDASRGFVGRAALLSRAAAIALGPSDSSAPWALSIEGRAGSGKSAFIAQFSRELAARDCCLLVHAATAGVGFGSVDAMLRRWIATLAARAGVHAARLDLSSPDRVDQTFASLLARVSDRERVVVLIDALDQFESSTRGRYATWLPREWPPNARLIVTANPCDASAALGERPGVERADMPPLDAAEGRAIITGVSARYHRTLDPEVIDVLLLKANPAGPACASPLWLVLAAETLNLVDADDLAGAWTLKSGSAADQLREMLIARADALAPDLAGVYTDTFDRAGKVFGAALTGTWLSLIAVSRGGWRHTDFLTLLPALTGEPWDELRFAQLRRFFRGQVRQAGAHGQWGFAHGTMADAVRDHPRVSRLVSDELSATIARHLLALPADDALRQTETMIHLLSAHDWSGAARYYGGDLSDAELSGATDVLVGAALIPPEGDVGGGLWYVSQILKADLDDAAHVEYAAQRVMYSVFDRLRVRGPLDTQVRLGCALIACFDTLTLLIPFTRVGPHLAAAYDRVGDALFEQRKFKESEDFQTKSHETLLALLEHEPDRLEWRRDLALGFNKRGKAQEAQGDLPAALQSFMAGLELIQRVSTTRPDDLLWKQDVATSHDLISGLHLKLGNVDAASASRMAAERIDPELSARAGSELDREFRAAFAEGRRGREESARGDFGAAELSYASSVRILEALVARDPANTHWLHALCVTAADLGRVQEQQGDETTAASTLVAAVGIGERLVELDDKRAVWWSDLANTSLRLMNLGLRHVNDPDFSDERRALLGTQLEQTARAFEKLVSLEPDNQGAGERLTSCRQNLATLRRM